MVSMEMEHPQRLNRTGSLNGRRSDRYRGCELSIHIHALKKERSQDRPPHLRATRPKTQEDNSTNEAKNIVKLFIYIEPATAPRSVNEPVILPAPRADTPSVS